MFLWQAIQKLCFWIEGSVRNLAMVLDHNSQGITHAMHEINIIISITYLLSLVYPLLIPYYLYTLYIVVRALFNSLSDPMSLKIDCIWKLLFDWKRVYDYSISIVISRRDILARYLRPIQSTSTQRRQFMWESCKTNSINIMSINNYLVQIALRSFLT